MSGEQMRPGAMAKRSRWRIEYGDAPMALASGDLAKAQRWYPQWLLQAESYALAVGMLVALLGWATHTQRLAYVGLSLSAAAVATYLLRRRWTMFADFGWLRSILVMVSLASLLGLQWYMTQGQWASGCYLLWVGGAMLNRNLPRVIARVTKRSRRDTLADV